MCSLQSFAWLALIHSSTHLPQFELWPYINKQTLKSMGDERPAVFFARVLFDLKPNRLQIHVFGNSHKIARIQIQPTATKFAYRLLGNMRSCRKINYTRCFFIEPVVFYIYQRVISVTEAHTFIKHMSEITKVSMQQAGSAHRAHFPRLLAAEHIDGDAHSLSLFLCASCV